ncbi:MAG: PAS-domain containing protein [Roseococcus sp.]|nr:PAS-domain containing protein [Roseococcus sp.]
MTPGRRLRIGIIAGLSLILVAQSLAVLSLLDSSRRAAIEAATSLTDRAGHSVQDAINRALFQIDATLASLPALLDPYVVQGPGGRGPGLDRQGANTLLRNINSQNFAFRDLILADEQGVAVATALPSSRRRPLPAPAPDASIAAGLNATGLSVSDAIRNPATGEWALFFSRPLRVAGLGPLTGIAEVQVTALGSLMAPGLNTPGLRIWLERSDGAILAATGDDGGRHLQPESGAFGTVVIRPSRLDGREVINTTWQTLYPALRLTAEMDMEQALAGWRASRDRTVLIWALFAVLLVALMVALLFWIALRDRAEADRLTWRQQLEDALNSMADGFVMFDAEDRLVVCNSSYREMYSISAPFIRPGALFDDIVREGARRGQYPQLEGHETESNIDHFIEDLKQRRRQGTLQQIERLLPDGRWLLLTERPVPHGGIVGIRTDITELKRAMAELGDARDLAQRASAAKGMFLARMSHELRTPLNAVLGFTDLLMQNGTVSGEQREQLSLVQDAAAHLRDVVNTLLDLSKAEARSPEMKPRPAALRPLAEVCAALVAPEVGRRRIALALDFDSALPATVLVDPLPLRQVLLNLLSNAVKFTPTGERVVVRLRNMPAPDWIRIEVEDSGVGIPPDKRDMLFREFSQISAPIDPQAASTGLGLSISAQLVTAMGGRIGCESAPIRGSIFWVELPMPAVDAGPERAAPPPPQPATERSLRLLVADDILVNRTLARIMLERAGHHVELVSNGIEAVEAVQHAHYDAVLMDVQMPLMDGLEATRRIRALPAPASQVVIVALSASAMTDQVEACLAAGMDGHLAKPINRAELLAKLDQLAASRAAKRAEPLNPEFMEEIRRGLKLLPSHAARGDLPGLAAAARELVPALRELQAADAAEATLRLQRVAQDGGEVAGEIAAWQRATASLELQLREYPGPPSEEKHVRGFA